MLWYAAALFACLVMVVLLDGRRQMARLEAARADVRTLSDQSLEALRMLLEGLAAERVP